MCNRLWLTRFFRDVSHGRYMDRNWAKRPTLCCTHPGAFAKYLKPGAIKTCASAGLLLNRKNWLTLCRYRIFVQLISNVPARQSNWLVFYWQWLSFAIPHIWSNVGKLYAKMRRRWLKSWRKISKDFDSYITGKWIGKLWKFEEVQDRSPTVVILIQIVSLHLARWDTRLTTAKAYLRKTVLRAALRCKSNGW